MQKNCLILNNDYKNKIKLAKFNCDNRCEAPNMTVVDPDSNETYNYCPIEEVSEDDYNKYDKDGFYPDNINTILCVTRDDYDKKKEQARKLCYKDCMSPIMKYTDPDTKDFTKYCQILDQNFNDAAFEREEYNKKYYLNNIHPDVIKHVFYCNLSQDDYDKKIELAKKSCSKNCKAPSMTATDQDSGEIYKYCPTDKVLLDDYKKYNNDGFYPDNINTIECNN